MSIHRPSLGLATRFLAIQGPKALSRPRRARNLYAHATYTPADGAQRKSAISMVGI
jgi:hypothetical protein